MTSTGLICTTLVHTCWMRIPHRMVKYMHMTPLPTCENPLYRQRFYTNRLSRAVSRSNYIIRFLRERLKLNVIYEMSFFYAVSTTFDANEASFWIEAGGRYIALNEPLDAYITPFQYRQYAISFSAQSASPLISIDVYCNKNSNFYFDSFRITEGSVPAECEETP